MTYDILFTASTYLSASNALRFVKSIKHIEGNHICILVSPLQTDILKIVADLRNADSLGCRVLAFLSDVNSLYQGRGWGFVWAVANGISAKYLCSGDDDIEFIENSHDIVARLDANDFSVMTFSTKVKNETNGIDRSKIWLNGDSMFTHFEDNLLYGVADALLDYQITYYTEIEYQQRMSFFTGKGLVVDREHQFYRHHFRNNDKMNKLREQHATQGIYSGKRLWKEKYDIEFDGVHIDVAKLYTQVCQIPERMKTHFIFHGLWNDWPAIYERLKSQFHLVFDTENPPWA